jgi:hypothetical protein
VPEPGLPPRHIDVPWSNKHFELKWSISLRSSAEPKETWTLEIKIKIQNQNTERAVAEMVATLYDESLDQFSATIGCSDSVFCYDYSQRGGTSRTW